MRNQLWPSATQWAVRQLPSYNSSSDGHSNWTRGDEHTLQQGKLQLDISQTNFHSVWHSSRLRFPGRLWKIQPWRFSEEQGR